MPNGAEYEKPRTLRPGDHICSVYERDDELAELVAAFLVDGLARGERTWYVPSGDETDAIRSALKRRGVDIDKESERTALQLFERSDTYAVHGGFDPEQTMRVFNEAIELALNDGFKGFRAAAEMSWALDLEDGGAALIAYESLLRTLFSTSPATGLCLYDKRRMPTPWVRGALLTHPMVAVAGTFMPNRSYDPAVRGLYDVDALSAHPARKV